MHAHQCHAVHAMPSMQSFYAVYPWHPWHPSLQFNDVFTMAINGENVAKLRDGVPVTINNLVPNKDDRDTDHADYVNNPQMHYFPYTVCVYTGTMLLAQLCIRKMAGVHQGPHGQGNDDIWSQHHQHHGH